MELFEARDHYIIQNGEHGLWCNRNTGTLTPKRGEDICLAWNPVCMGIVHGVIGKMKFHPESGWKLLLIRQHSLVGILPTGVEVNKIDKIFVLPLSMETQKDLQLDLCHKHHFGISKQSDLAKGEGKTLQKTWNSIKSAAENVKPKKLPFRLPPIGEMVSPLQHQAPQQREIKEKERFERRIQEEVIRMFSEGENFYFTYKGDLTNTIQRLHSPGDSKTQAAWKNADDRFFWNKTMVDDLISSETELADPWIIPLVQGFVQIESCVISFEDEVLGGSVENVYTKSEEYDYQLCLISRRSRFRAGTRYRRRGVDETGSCANYVETEQILQFANHIISFVQVRGSVPLYWSQTGIKYKPPPRIDKGEAENSEAFKKHMTDQISRYGHVSAINLVDQQGKEKVIADTFLRHVLTLNSSDLSYIAFDFHEYCRGMQFENVSILTENILDIIKEMKYCWADQGGLICHQQGVFRVNCMDCLDRTNLVQSAIARIVLEVQCRKLGLLPPDEHLPPKCRSIYQQMWANNGDTVSRQYAGTAALKGDYTRTGERKLTGLMKDGVNSANRYYINRVKDVYRQATIDLMLGSYQFEELLSLLNRSTDSPDSAECESQELLREKEENLKTLIDECKKMLITEPDSCLGGWGLIDCDPITGDPSQQDMDIILLLSQQACYVANYDDETDQVTNYQRIDLNDLVSLELGPAPAIFKSRHMCMRLNYCYKGKAGYFHTFRTTNTRLFNNIVIMIKNDDEAKESLQGICESINAAKKLLTSDELSLYEGKLIRKKTRPHPNILSIADQQQEHLKGMGASAKTSSTSVSTSSLLAPTSFLTRVASNPDSLKWAGQKFFNLGRNLEIFNPNSKHFSRVKRKFIPAVLYSKNSDSVPTSESDDSARIIKGESIPETLDSPLIADKPEVMMDHRPLVSSTSDSDLSTCDMDIDFGIFDNHVMLPTCGMLAVKPNQVVTAKIRQRANYKLSRKQSTEARNDVIRRKVRKDIKLKTKSLDLEDRLSSRASSWSGDDLKMNATEFFLSPSEEDEDCDASESEVETAEEDSLVTPTNAIQNIEFPNQEIITPTVEEAQMNFPANDTADITVTISSDGPPVNQSASSNVTPNPSPKSSPLLHPSMKMSFSEGSIATAFHTTEIGSSYENIDLDDLDDLDLSEGHLSRPSTFAKLRGKMPNLSIPTMPSPGAKRKVAERASKQNRIKSQLRFQECKTRIILL